MYTWLASMTNANWFEICKYHDLYPLPLQTLGLDVFTKKFTLSIYKYSTFIWCN